MDAELDVMICAYIAVNSLDDFATGRRCSGGRQPRCSCDVAWTVEGTATEAGRYIICGSLQLSQLWNLRTTSQKGSCSGPIRSSARRGWVVLQQAKTEQCQ